MQLRFRVLQVHRELAHPIAAATIAVLDAAASTHTPRRRRRRRIRSGPVVRSERLEGKDVAILERGAPTPSRTPPPVAALL